MNINLQFLWEITQNMVPGLYSISVFSFIKNKNKLSSTMIVSFCIPTIKE